MVTVSGIGSWPGTDARTTLLTLREELTGEPGDGVAGMPYLPELADRGPGADMLGRTAHLLVDLPVDLQPQGWRLTSRPGRDAQRSASWWREDLDELAEVFSGWTGRLKLQVVGPWTLASELWLPKGERVLSDAGAVRDLAASLSAGIDDHLTRVQHLLPQASLVLQIDEPGLPRVLRGQVPSASGYRRLESPDADYAAALLRGQTTAARQAGAAVTLIHCCADRPPLSVLREGAPGGLAVDIVSLDAATWESVAMAVEVGTGLVAGAMAPDADPASYREAHDLLVDRWRRVGLPLAALAQVGVTPACGLAGTSPRQALALTRATVHLARELAQTAAG
ncbi:MAG TPA: methionine synthase [Ornithinimicrobium sp.]|uniref:methionine synthase n=1 Tax=Ornithinimicrobium sp. TaxID=1977084 RepID=UPI002B472C90|nr:methionine synthase [Ornithinimicrobium sp.]HKJ12446.1 methionine synthase [Ornithinimicrobium sp.]